MFANKTLTPLKTANMIYFRPLTKKLITDDKKTGNKDYKTVPF